MNNVEYLDFTFTLLAWADCGLAECATIQTVLAAQIVAHIQD